MKTAFFSAWVLFCTAPADHTSGPDGASDAHTADPTPAPKALTPVEILGLFSDWIKQVPQRISQFTPELKAIHAQLWQAAVTSWGAPTYKYIAGTVTPKGSTPSGPPAAGSKAAASGAKSQNAKAPVDMRTAPGTQPVPGGLTGSLVKVGLNALLNVKKQ